MLSVLKKCKGRHCSISDIIPEEDCFVAGCVIEEKRGNRAMEIQKYILNEVLPDGGSGKNFALFVMGVSSSLPVRKNDIFVIHCPSISKSNLIKHKDLLNQKYEDQITVQQEVVDIHDIASEDKKVIELQGYERLQLDGDLQPDDNSEVEEGKKLQSQKSSCCKRLYSPEEESDKINGEKGFDYVKKRKNNDLQELSPQGYTKLKDINSASVTVNIIGIIRYVEEGTQLGNGERLMKIYIEDESVIGSKFQLNLISRIIDVPPLHYGYILKASNVVIQKVGEEISGWLSSGKSIATVESDIEKPIILLTTQIDPDLTDEDRNRICDLREFINHNACNYAMSSESEKSVSDSEEKQSNQLRETSKSAADDSDEDCSLRLHLSSSESNESPLHIQDPEEL